VFKQWKRANFFWAPTFHTQANPHVAGELGTSEMSSEVGQSVGGSDGSEQTLPEHQPEGGPNSIPSITVTHATEEAAAATETEEEMPTPQLAGTVTTVIDYAKFTIVQIFGGIGKHFCIHQDTY
jgi:hypothetical protein